MKKLYLIRHAECKVNLMPEYIWGRSNNSEVTPKGYHQIDHLRRRLDNELDGDTILGIYSSSAIRACETAYGSLPQLKDRIKVCDDLLELEQGNWTGQLRRRVYTKEVMDAMKHDPWNFKAPGGESQEEVGERMMRWLGHEFLSDKLEGTVLAYSHGVAIKCLLRNIMNFDRSMTWRVQLDNTSITQINYDNGMWWPVRINDASHIRTLELENIS